MIRFLAKTCIFLIGLFIANYVEEKWHLGAMYFFGWIAMDISIWVLRKKKKKDD